MPIKKEVECSTLDLSTTTLLPYVYFYNWRESLMYLSPNWLLSSVQSVKHFVCFFEMLSAEHIVVFWFPLLCGKVPSVHCHLPLLFSGFIFKWKSMERKLLCQLFTATNCSTLTRHALKCARLFPIQFCSSRYWAMQVSCLDITEVTWPKPRIFSCRLIQINTLTYLRKMSMYQTNSMYVKLYLYSTM